jgi:hypothetical protein
MGRTFWEREPGADMNRIKTIALALLLASLPSVGWSAFTCQKNGSTIYDGDKIPAECSGVEIRELYPDGSLKKVIPPPLTREQKEQRDQKEKERQACIEMNRKQNDLDNVLLDRYKHEEDLQEARYRAVGDQLQRVDQANARMKEILKDGMNLAEQAMFYQPPNQKPDELQRNRAVNFRLERGQLRVIEDAVAEIGRINETYDSRLERYRAVTSHTAKMPCDAAKYATPPTP